MREELKEMKDRQRPGEKKGKGGMRGMAVLGRR